MGAEPQEPFLDSGSEEAGKLEPSLSDVQLVEAFFDVEGRLEAALAAARHPATAPQVASILIAWLLGVWVEHRLPQVHVVPSLGGSIVCTAHCTITQPKTYAQRHAILLHVKLFIANPYSQCHYRVYIRRYIPAIFRLQAACAGLVHTHMTASRHAFD